MKEAFFIKRQTYLASGWTKIQKRKGACAVGNAEIHPGFSSEKPLCSGARFAPLFEKPSLGFPMEFSGIQ